MNKKYILIGLIGIVAVYFIYKKFSEKKESEKNEEKNNGIAPLNPLALKPKPNLPNSPYAIIDNNTKPQFNETETAFGLEKKYNNAYC